MVAGDRRIVRGWPADGRPDYDGLPMPWLSLPEYARRTGTPESTVRALIRAGKLEGHQEQRAPGDPRVVWKVWVDDPQEQPQAHPQPPAGPRMPSESPQQQPPATEPPELVTGLLAIIEADRATIAEKDARLMEAAERIAGLSRELGDATTRAAMLEAERDELARRLDRAEWRWWHRWTRGTKPPGG